MRLRFTSRRFALAALLLCSQSATTALAGKVGDILPKVSVGNKEGKAEEPWAGKVSLINFWATWCEACKVELKEMEKEMAKVAPDQKVVFVSLDKDPSKAKEWMAGEFKGSTVMSDNLYHDEAFKLADALGVSSFPMTVVVDQKGKIIKVQEGFKEGAGTTVALFNAMKDAKAQ